MNNVDLPTTGLTPETSINYEIGAKLDYRRLRAQTYYFWTDIEGLIDTALWIETQLGRAVPAMVSRAGNFPPAELRA